VLQFGGDVLGADAQCTTGQLAFNENNWDKPKTVVVVGLDDAVQDGDQGYKITLHPAIATDPNYSGVDPDDVAVVNVDDDAGGVTVNAGSAMLTSESGTSSAFTAVLKSQPSGMVKICLSSSDPTEGVIAIAGNVLGPDGSCPVARLEFGTSNWSVPQTVTVTGVDDTEADGNQPYMVVLAPAISADLVYQNVDPSDVSFTNVDNDSPNITVSTGASMVTSESGTSTTFAIVLNSQPLSLVKICLASSNTNEGVVSVGGDVLGADGQCPVARVEFTTGNWSTPKNVVVTGINDNQADGTQPYSVVIAPAISSDPNYGGVNANDVSLINVDDDSFGIQVNAGSAMVTSESGTSSSLTVVLNSQPTADVKICLSSSDTSEGIIPVSGSVLGSDLDCPNERLQFTTGNWNVAQTVTVTGVDDSLDDGNVGYSVVLGAAISSDSNYGGINPADVSFTNVDNDIVGVTVLAGSAMVTSESGISSSFTVVLNAQPTAAVYICLNSSDTSEGTIPLAGNVLGAGNGCANQRLDFTTGNWSTPQTVTVTGVDDGVVDGNIAYTIQTTTSASSAAEYIGQNPADVSFTNVDNDIVGVTVLAGSAMVTSESGISSSFTVVLNAQPTAAVYICLNSSDTSEGTIPLAGNVLGAGNGCANQRLDFTTGNWSTPQTVTVTGVDDGVVDGNIAYTIQTTTSASSAAEYIGQNPADVSFTNVDNDTPGITVNAGPQLGTSERGAVSSFSIVLNTQPTDTVTLCLSSTDTTEGVISIGGDVQGAGATCSGWDARVQFTTGDWNTPKVVPVVGQDDAIGDGDIAYQITISAAISSDTDYNGINPPDLNCVNYDD
jgi:hypothetical protein